MKVKRASLKSVVFLCGAIACLTLLFLWFWKPQEPIYQGKKLGAWLQILDPILVSFKNPPDPNSYNYFEINDEEFRSKATRALANKELSLRRILMKQIGANMQPEKLEVPVIDENAV